MSSQTDQTPQNPSANPSNIFILPDTVSKSNKTEIFQTTPHPTSEPDQPVSAELEVVQEQPEQEEPEQEEPEQTYICEHVKANGLPCRSPALRGQPYCYFHHLWRTRPAYKPTRPWNSKKNQVGKLPLLEDPESVQIALQQVLDAILDKRLDLPRARLLLYGLQTAAVNVMHTNFDPLAQRHCIATELR